MNQPANATMEDAVGNKNLSDKLQGIGSRKALLNHVMEIAKNAERIEQSLQSVLLLGKPNADIPPEAIAFFKGLSGQVKNQPVEKVKDYLKRLEKLVKVDLYKILAMADADEDELGPGDRQDESIQFQDITKLLNDYRRRAQTAVSLRVLLKERGEKTDVMALPVPEYVIQKQIFALEEREARYGVRIKNEIGEMQADIEVLLKDPMLPEEVRKDLNGVNAELTENMAHLMDGKHIEDLPFQYESLNNDVASEALLARAAERAQLAAETKEDIVVEEHDVQEEEIIVEEPRPQAEEAVKEAPEAKVKQGPVPTSPAPVTKERGFVGQLMTWITTPPKVTWKQAKTWQKK